ncbi:MAG: exodeoxyribonuclease VII large subunit [Eubacteriales bacterium]|nr:exodeoxyribonuclease VII large subunit [Eubacteriales bacterium]
MAGVYTVTQMNSYIKNMFRQDFVLNRISIKGEISNCKYHTSGHIYFTLKDEGGVLSAIMFASQAGMLDFHLDNGMKVVVQGKIDVYERDGKYQLYANSITLDGIGDLYKKYEQLKEHFEEMGYFAREYKRPIPEFARKIGIVTASTGAAVHDIMNIAHRRNPYVSLYLYPAQVQGEMAKYSIVKGIEVLDSMKPDVIIVGRGGGSLEDLWAFNEEIVAEAIFNASTPVISAVGHETDFTIADFVADLRAPTPSAAAELAVCDILQVESRINTYATYLYNNLVNRIDRERNRIRQLELQFKLYNPASQINENRHRLIQLENHLDSLMKGHITAGRNKTAVFASRLEGVSPMLKLKQGYSYTEDAKGSQVSSVEDVRKGEELHVYVRDGVIISKVTEVNNGKRIDS